MAHALIFDSGVGGLSVVAEIRKLLPGVRLTYAADDAFRPYGEKSEAQLRARLPELLWTLAEMTNPDVIVIACNTASTTALDHIRDAVDIPVIGVVPAIKPAASSSASKVIGVLGTPGTVQRQYVNELISDFAKDCRVVRHGSVGLVALAEDKLAGKVISSEDVKAEIRPLFSKRGGKEIDSIVLACTHFPLLKAELQIAAPRSVTWIDSGEAIARQVKKVLSELKPKTAPAYQHETALLIGPAPTPERKAAFHKFGFERVVGLMPY